MRSQPNQHSANQPRHLWLTLLAACTLACALQTAHAEAPAPQAPKMETGFYPFGGAEELTVKAIASAKQSIYLAADTITSGAVAQALIDARKRGVNILAVLDKSQAKARKGGAKLLAKEGILVHIDSKHTGMHNNYMIIDRQTLQIGRVSYDQNTAKKNADNVLVVWDDLEAAKPYRANWQEHWDHATPYK